MLGMKEQTVTTLMSALVVNSNATTAQSVAIHPEVIPVLAEKVTLSKVVPA